MVDDPIADFVMFHGDCGPIDVKYAPDFVSVRCVVCGAVKNIAAAEDPEAVAATVEMLELAAAANFSAADRQVLSDPGSTSEDVTRILSAYPALQRALDKLYERQGRTTQIH
jgi:hypothetical protein